MLGFMILSSVLIILYVCWTHRVKRGYKLPPPYPDQWPIIGGGHDFLGRMKNAKDLLNLALKYGEFCNQNDGVVHTYAGPFLVFAVTDPDDSVTILNTCLEKNWMYDFSRSWVGDGLVTVTDLDMWKRHRKVINRAFSQYALDGYVGTFNKQAKWLVKEVTPKVGKGPFDHIDVLEDWSMGTMYQTMMGINEDEMNDIVPSSVIKGAIKGMLVIISKRFQYLWLLSQFTYSFSSMKKKEDELLSMIHNLSLEIIKKKRRAPHDTESAPKNFKPFLNLLLELPPQEAFTDKEILDEVTTMVVAGYDTSATMLTYFLILLGSYQNVQDKVYEELQRVFGNSLRDVERQDFPKLAYMEAVMLESMRLYPILPAITRYISKDVKLRNYTLPAGTNAFILPYHMHRNKQVWGPDAEEFRPERWLPTPPPAAKACASFSIGKRGCIGKAYAMRSMKVLLAHFLRHYRVFADVTKLELHLESFLKPASGYEIAIQRRT